MDRSPRLTSAAAQEWRAYHVTGTLQLRRDLNRSSHSNRLREFALLCFSCNSWCTIDFKFCHFNKRPMFTCWSFHDELATLKCSQPSSFLVLFEISGIFRIIPRLLGIWHSLLSRANEKPVRQASCGALSGEELQEQWAGSQLRQSSC